MKVKKSVLQALFLGVGYESADSWTNARLLQKVKKLPDVLEEEKLDKEACDDEEAMKAAAALVKEIKADGSIVDDIELVDDTEKKGKKGGKKKAEKKTKKGMKSKAKAEDDDDDDDDDEEEEDEDEDDDSDEDESDDDDDDEEDEEDDDEDEDDSDDEDEEDESDDEDDEDSEDDEEDEDVDDEDDDDKKSKKKGKKSKKGKAGKKAGGSGVAAAVIGLLKEASADKPLSVKMAVKKLAKKFPDREDRIRSCMRTSFLKRRGLVPKKSEDGKGLFLKKGKKK